MALALAGASQLNASDGATRSSTDDAPVNAPPRPSASGLHSGQVGEIVLLKAESITGPTALPRPENWWAPMGSGGLRLRYLPNSDQGHEVLLQAYPLLVEVTSANAVRVAWTRASEPLDIEVPFARRAGRAVDIHWRCKGGYWSLTVADQTDTIARQNRTRCINDNWSTLVHLGGHQDLSLPIDGTLSITWYADPSTLPDGLAFEGDFETGDLTQWVNVGARLNYDYAMSVTRESAAGGDYAARMEVRHADRGFDADGRPRKVRAEVFEYRVGAKEDWWYGWSSRIDPAWKDQAKDFFVIQQFHQELGSPPLGQRYIGGRWIVYCNVCGQRQVELWSRPMPKDRWVDWVYHVRWSWEDDGFVRVWKDGEKIIDYTGPSMKPARKGPYFKFGIYRGGTDELTQTIWHDEYRRGHSRASVDPASYR